MAKTLKISTPHGEFTRSTASVYTHAVVRSCPRSAEEFEYFKALTDPREIRGAKQGVSGRWIKDRGYAVTWHKSEAAAQNAASGNYMWDHSAVVLGIFPVSE